MPKEDDMENQGILWKLKSSRSRLFPWKLSSLGIKLSPYYVYREELHGCKPIIFGSEFAACETLFLGKQDMTELHCIDGRSNSEQDLCKRLEKGNKCFALKLNGNIVGFTWGDFETFTYPPGHHFNLDENEAYLFDAYILKAYRGHKLAPFLRYSFYQELKKMGRHILYSYSDYFNTPAVRFKEKLNARIVKLCLYIELFEKFTWNLTLKSYPENVSK
jgi:GNAT superfamily N-acetyltransferase